MALVASDTRLMNTTAASSKGERGFRQLGGDSIAMATAEPQRMNRTVLESSDVDREHESDLINYRNIRFHHLHKALEDVFEMRVVTSTPEGPEARV
ncbi:hypothetical protein R3I94_016677 [Phoxinus phoxinus]